MWTWNRVLGLVLLTALTFSFDVSAWAQGGVGTSGGGDVILTRNGKAMLVDLLPNQAIADSAMTVGEAKAFLYPSSMGRIVLDSAPDFIEQGLSVLANYVDIPAIRFLVEHSSKSLSAALTDAYFEPNALQLMRDLSGSTLSNRVSADRQTPVAVFEFNTLLLNLRLINRMSKRDIQALAVHELLRNLNFFLSADSVLTTDEIEALVRFFFLKEPCPQVLEKLKRIQIKNVGSGSAVLGSVDSLIDQYAAVKKKGYAPHMTLREVIQQKEMEHALLMQIFQQASPDHAIAPSRYLFDDAFSKIIADPSWKQALVTIHGRFNVMTHEIKCKSRRRPRFQMLSFSSTRRTRVNACLFL